MKIGIVGSSGYISGFLTERFTKDNLIDSIVGIDKTPDADVYLDLEKATEFDATVFETINYLIFTAAVSGPDQCAKYFEQCWKINVEGTIHIIEQALKHNCRVLFFSSDAVFGDIPGQIYTEQSQTCADTPYGQMKKYVEDKFKANTGFKAIRLSYVVSAKDRFVSYCKNCIQNGEVADIFHPFYRNCIVVSDVVDVVVWFIRNWDRYEPFVLNVAGNELVSRVRIADELNRIFNNRLKYSVSKPDESFFKNRPQITQMKSLYLQKYQILEERTFTDRIQKELEDIEL